MIQISYETNLPEKIKAFEKLPDIMQASRRSALSSAGFFLLKETQDFIDSEGKGSWPKEHPMSQFFYKKYFVGGKFFPLFRPRFNWMSALLHYNINFNATDCSLVFKRKGVPFSVYKLMEKIQTGEVTQATPKMRGLFGSTRGQYPGAQVPGKTFFPLRRQENEINLKPRPVEKPVFASAGGRVPKLFEEKLAIALNKRFEKL